MAVLLLIWRSWPWPRFSSPMHPATRWCRRCLCLAAAVTSFQLSVIFFFLLVAVGLLFHVRLGLPAKSFYLFFFLRPSSMEQFTKTPLIEHFQTETQNASTNIIRLRPELNSGLFSLDLHTVSFCYSPNRNKPWCTKPPQCHVTLSVAPVRRPVSLIDHWPAITCLSLSDVTSGGVPLDAGLPHATRWSVNDVFPIDDSQLKSPDVTIEVPVYQFNPFCPEFQNGDSD